MKRRGDFMRRARSHALLLAALALGILPGAGVAGTGHPPVVAGAACVTPRCHPGLLEPDVAAPGRSEHQPATDGDCGSCHDLAVRAGTPFVKGAPAGGGNGPERAEAWDLALCAGCHGEALVAVDAPAGATGFVDKNRNLHALHVQAARGPRCLPCHDPHVSPQAMLLRERIPARGGVLIPQEFRAEKNGGWCKTGCHAPKSYRR